MVESPKYAVLGREDEESEGFVLVAQKMTLQEAQERAARWRGKGVLDVRLFELRELPMPPETTSGEK